MAKIIPELRQAFNSYLRAKGLDSKTISDYNFFFDKLVNRYGEINQQIVDTYLSQNTSPSARATIVNLRKAVIRWDLPPEIKREVSAIDIPSRTARQGRPNPKVLRRSDVTTLDLKISLNTTYDSERLKLMIMVQFYAGLRISELCGISLSNLRVNDFNKDKKFQSIKISYESAKFGKERRAYIPTEIYRRLINWYKRRLKIQGHKDLSEKNIWGIKASRYKALLRQATKEILGEPYNSHSLRHGRGNDLRVNEKKPIDIVQKYLGHASIKSTQIYTHLGDAELEDDLEETPEIVELIE